MFGGFLMLWVGGAPVLNDTIEPIFVWL